jgi:hypothetical protein
MSKHDVEEFISSILGLEEVGLVDNADVELFISANTFQGQLKPFTRRVLVSKVPVSVGNEVFIWVNPETRTAYLSDIDSQSFVQVSEFNELFAHASDFFNITTNTPSGAIVPGGDVDNRWRVSQAQFVTNLEECTEGFCVVKSERKLYARKNTSYIPINAVLLVGNTG